MKTLVLLSGGYDSVAVLDRILAETQDVVTAFHLRWNLAGKDNAPETEAVRNIVPWLYRNRRPFRLETASFASSIGCGAAPMIWAALEAGTWLLKQGETFQRVLLGSIGPQSAGSRAFNEMAENLFEAMVEHRMVPPPFDYPFQAPEFSKSSMLRGMPDELRAMSWTCKDRRETGGAWTPCGVCAKCREYADALNNMETSS